MNGEVTRLLARLSDGDKAAYDRLLPILYAELKAVARNLMRYERNAPTLQTTALIHEAYLRLFELREVRWQDRAHFLKVAARAMRRVLVDHARQRRRLKRGGAVEKLPLDIVIDEAATFFGCPDLDVMALNWALDRLEEHYPRQSRVIELLFFAGLTRTETAEALEVSSKTIDRDWVFARTWLIRELEPSARAANRPLATEHEPTEHAPSAERERIP